LLKKSGGNAGFFFARQSNTYFAGADVTVAIWQFFKTLNSEHERLYPSEHLAFMKRVITQTSMSA